MKPITDLTVDEINYTLDAAMEGIRLRNLYRPREIGDAVRTFAVHLIERMRDYRRLSLCMDYEEAAGFVMCGEQIIAGPVISDLETAVNILHTLHCFHAIHNANTARGLSEGAMRLDRHWTSSMDVIAGVDFNTHTPIHFQLHPVYVEATLRYHQRRLGEVVAAQKYPMFHTQPCTSSFFREDGTSRKSAGPSERVGKATDAYMAQALAESEG